MSEDTNLAQQILAWIKRAEEETQAPECTSYERAVDRQSVLVDDIQKLCQEHIAANPLMVRGTATVECEYEGKRYKGIVYEVGASE